MKSAIFGLVTATVPLWAMPIIAYYAMRGALIGFLNGIAYAAFKCVDIIDKYRP